MTTATMHGGSDMTGGSRRRSWRKAVPVDTYDLSVRIGSSPMDFAFRGAEIFVGCQGDGTMHVIDVPSRRNKQSFKAGAGCESVGFF